MQYKPSFNIWAIPEAKIKNIKRGQWVYAGDRANKGIFLGVRKSGVVVVAWYYNAKRDNWREYIKALTAYSKG